MTDFSLGQKAVWRMQHLSTELVESVWSVWFYEHLLDVLRNDSWRSFTSEAFGRPCQFDNLADFLASKDGLGWPTVPEVLEMIAIVSKCSPPPPPRKNEPVDPPITEWARQALEALSPHITLQSAQAQAAKSQPLAEQRRPTAKEQQANKVANRHLKPANKLSSESQERLLRRIARDNPELLDQIGPGKEHRSARAAAIAAGIIHPVPTIRLVPNPVKVAASIRRHLDPQQVASLVEELLR